jgi:hypothetical protein
MQLKNQQEMYNELSYYTLSHSDPSFIHRNIVDAFAAQTAGENTKPIKLFGDCMRSVLALSGASSWRLPISRQFRSI